MFAGTNQWKNRRRLFIQTGSHLAGTAESIGFLTIIYLMLKILLFNEGQLEMFDKKKQ